MCFVTPTEANEVSTATQTPPKPTFNGTKPGLRPSHRSLPFCPWRGASWAGTFSQTKIPPIGCSSSPRSLYMLVLASSRLSRAIVVPESSYNLTRFHLKPSVESLGRRFVQFYWPFHWLLSPPSIGHFLAISTAVFLVSRPNIVIWHALLSINCIPPSECGHRPCRLKLTAKHQQELFIRTNTFKQAVTR